MKYSLFIVWLLSSCLSHSEDWPRFGGLKGDFTTNEDSLRIDWGTAFPNEIWKLDVGLGFSSVIESDNKAYTQGYSDGKILLFCIGVEKGKVLWKKQFPCSKGDNYFKGGSRSTPMVYEKKLYMVTHDGDFYCMDSNTGRILWAINLVDDLGGVRPTWGYGASPIIAGQNVILAVGAKDSALVALNKDSGKVAWKSGSYEAAYSTPHKLQNTDEIAVFHGSGLSIHGYIDGVENRFFQHKTRYGINASQPIQIENKLFLSSAYGKGSVLVDFSKAKPKVDWKTEKIASQMASSVFKDGYIYGVHGQAGSRSKFSTLFCLDVKKCKVTWEKKGFSLGSLILVKNTLLFLTENGELILFNATPEEFQELTNFQVLSGKDNWIPPTYSHGRMYCRSSDGELICLAMGTNYY
jgi:outer membrane protein assembly factor BamB